MKYILIIGITLLLIVIFSIDGKGQTKSKKQLSCTVTEIIERKKNGVHCLAVTESGRIISIKRTGSRSVEIVPGTKLILISRHKVRYDNWAICEIRLITNKK